MLKTVTLLASLCANFAFAVGLMRAPSAAAITQSTSAPAVADSRARQRLALPRDASAYYRALQTLGLDEHEAKLLLVAQLEGEALAGLVTPDRYWQPLREPLAEHATAVAAAQEQVRRTLVAVLGPRASSSPELARVFRPLDSQFRFLPPEQQVALQTWQLGRRRDEAGETTTAIAGPGLGAAAAARAPRFGDELAELRDVLPSAAAFEVAIRTSPLAEQLRASGADMGEAEFREAFALLGNAAAMRDAQAQLTLRRRLRSLLGAERFDRVWAGRDPLAAVVRRVGAERGLDEDLVLRAYGVLNVNQERLIELAALGQPTSESTISAARTIAEDEQVELERAVGAEIARAILDARNAYLIAASRAAPRAAAQQGR